VVVGWSLSHLCQATPRTLVRRLAGRLGKAIRGGAAELLARLTAGHVSDREFARTLADFETVEGFLRLIRTSQMPAFFFPSSSRERIVHALHQAHPTAREMALARADRICAHVLNLLGSGDVHLGRFEAVSSRVTGAGDWPWHCDFKSGHSWNARTYYKRSRPAPYPGGYDIKVPWELSRCQHFAWLGQACWFTGDERYAQEFVAQVLDWIDQNPPQFGVNWACTMDVAIRAINWLWGYHFFRDSRALGDEFRLALFKSLLAHGRHIFGNLEWSEQLTSNHYLSDLVGLVTLGILLPEFKEATQWRKKGLDELWSEMEKQVYPDGVDFEASTSYHRLATELFLSPIILCQLNGIPVPSEVMDRLEKMVEFVMYYTKPDGTVPLIGDADNGRLHRLKVWDDPAREWIDHRYLLAIGAVLFEREDLAQAAGDQWEEAIWLLGERAIAFKEQFEAKKRPPLRLGSRAFPHAGIYVMRRDEDLYLILDAGPNGQNGNGGHAHNDTLSFEVYAYGRTFLCDPGAYVYTADYRWRNRFRSTAYHNTVVVDGEEMNRFVDRRLFQMRNDAIPKVHRWEVSGSADFFDGEHSGYERLKEPVTHRRQVYFDKREGLWIIRDRLTGAGEHRFDLYFNFSPLTLLFDEGDPLAVRTDCAGGASLAVVPLDREGLSAEISQGWVSYSYGTKIEAPVVRYSKTAHVPAEFLTVLFPMRGKMTAQEIQRVATASLARLPSAWLSVPREEESS
jgi:hypothetical protein